MYPPGKERTLPGNLVKRNNQESHWFFQGHLTSLSCQGKLERRGEQESMEQLPTSMSLRGWLDSSRYTELEAKLGHPIMVVSVLNHIPQS